MPLFKKFSIAVLVSLSLAGCAQTPKDLKIQAPIISQEINKDWESASNCLISYLDDNMNFGIFGISASNSLRTNTKEKRSEIISKSPDNLTVISVMNIEAISANRSLVEARSSTYQMHVFTTDLENTLKASVTSCGP